MRMLDPDWEARVKALDEVHTNANRYEGLDDPNICEQMTFANKYFVCVQGEYGKLIKTNKLSKDFSESLNLCSKCQISRTQKRELKNALNELKTTKEKYANGINARIPSCVRGGQLSTDGKKIMCKDPKKSPQYRDVNKFCKIIKGGANCEYLRWTTIMIQGKQFELDEKSR